jgi:pyruvate kinase
MKRRSKIIATLGPATEELYMIEKLIQAGLNIARLNFSHGSYEQSAKIVKNIRKVEKKTGKTIGILQDLQGPKIRLGLLPEEGIPVKKGQNLHFSNHKKSATQESGTEKNPIPIPYEPLKRVLKKGQRLLIEDGMIAAKVLSVKKGIVKVKIQNAGLLKSRKGVNLPDSTLPASASLTAKDKKDLKFGLTKLKVDAVAISFVEDKNDILRVRKEIAKHTKKKILIIAKIERKNALINIQEIIDVSDGIMVARGDLGIETEAERVPVEQKRILALARQAGKPVIIATQVLQSMIENPIPTRAEISDAANAIFDHADAVMLSNESAIGKYPVKAVQTLAKVASRTEEVMFETRELFPVKSIHSPSHLEDEALSLNACYLAEKVDADAIVIRTNEGYTAQTVLKHRPKSEVIVLTNNKQTARQLHFWWGTHTVHLVKGSMRSEESIQELKKAKIIKKGSELVLVKLTKKKKSLVLMKV